MRVRLLAVAATFAALIALVAVYVVYFLESGPPAVAAVINRDGSASLTLQVVGAYGHHPFPDWVSYLVKDPSGKWGWTFVTKPTSGAGGFGPYDRYNFGRDGQPNT